MNAINTERKNTFTEEGKVMNGNFSEKPQF